MKGFFVSIYLFIFKEWESERVSMRHDDECVL